MKNIIKKIFLSIICLLLIGLFVSGLIFAPKIYNLYKFSKEYINKPFSKDELQKNESRVLKIYDRNNIMLANLFPEYGGFYKEVKYSDLPQNLIDAVISAEDKNFFSHKGIDYKAILRAFISNLLNRKIVSGGSTITQQLSKSLIHRERNYINKFYEALDSIRLEKNMTKEEILTEYLNRIFFGNNCYGIGAAAELYFKKEVKDLNISESAILASIIKSGTKFNPYKYNEKLNTRKIYVLCQMKKNNFITEEDYNNSINENITIYTNREKNTLKAPHFVMYIKDSIGKLKYSNLIEVKTTLDYKLQKEASLVISNASQSLHSFNVRNISCVILNAKTGEILSMIGSMDYFDKETDGSVNGAIALRQPGSALKPFLYAYLFDKGESPASVIGDIKTYISSPGGDYIPENFDRKYRGPVTIRDALANSLNIPAVRWLSKYSLKDFQNILLKSGLNSIDKNPDYYGYSLVLGSAEVRLIDLASAYTIFPNSGIFINHYSTISLKKENGETFYIPKKSSNYKKVISEESAYLINKILSDRNARQGSFRSYRGLVYPFSVAIKTGTSKGSRDAWAVGYTKDYIVGLWLGDFKGSEMINITGGNGAVPILYDLFFILNKSQKETEWNKPSDIVEREICLISGKLRGEFCKETRLEEFSISNVVKDECDVHNLYIKMNSDGSIDKKVFLNLPSEYNDWLKEMQIEKPTSEWIMAKNTYAYNNVNQINNLNSLNSLNNQNQNERISITSPTDNSIYKIDSTLPLKYQNIFISSYIPKNIAEANLYCNEEIIANIEELKNGAISWNLKRGDYTFYIKAVNFEGNELKSPNINIFIQ